MKYVDSPGLFRELIQDFELAPQHVSKYRLSVQSLNLAVEPVLAASMLSGD
jgi:hypothetical protein